MYFMKSPLPYGHALTEIPNVVLSTHSAWYTPEASLSAGSEIGLERLAAKKSIGGNDPLMKLLGGFHGDARHANTVNTDSRLIVSKGATD